MIKENGGKSVALIYMAAFVVCVAGMKEATDLIVPFLLAIFLAIICSPLLFWMQKKRVPNVIAILLIISGVVCAVVGLGVLLGSSLAEFTKAIPEYQEKLRLMMDKGWGWLVSHGVTLERSVISDAIDPGKIMRVAANTLNSLGGVLTNAFLILFMFLFLLLEAAGIPLKIKAIAGKQSSALKKFTEVNLGVNRYLAIKTATSLATGFIIGTFLLVQGVDFAIMWGVCAFFLNFIPNIGSIIAAIPAVLLSLVQLGPNAALVTAGGYFVVNILVGSLLEPKIMGKDMGLSTLVVFLSLVFWGWVLGPVGMLLSVPLTMTAKIVLSGNEETRWLSILLGSNREVSEMLNKE